MERSSGPGTSPLSWTATGPLAPSATNGRIRGDRQAAGGKLRQNAAHHREFLVEPRFLLLSDVAAELNVSDSQVYHMVRSGELPAIKIGGRGQWRVERARLEEYIQQKYAETAEWVRSNPLVERDPEQA
jgi:excisionase family DNA binding protein